MCGIYQFNNYVFYGGIMRFIVTRTDKNIRCSYPDAIDYSAEAGDLLTTLLEDVVQATGLSHDLLFTHTRRRSIALGRHLFCFIARRHLGMFSLQEIAAVFGINHATVVHAVHNIENMLQLNDYVSLMVQLQYLQILGLPPTPSNLEGEKEQTTNNEQQTQ
jgi:hypothetical protein